MNNYLRLGYLGLSDDQINTVKSIFNLSADLRKAWILTGSSEISNADVVLVNLDEVKGLTEWKSLSNINLKVTPIVLSATEKSIEGITSLKFPIRLAKLKEALLNIDLNRG